MNIRDLLLSVWNNPHSDFYRKKYEAVGLTEDAIADPARFADIPFLTKQELEATPAEDRLHVPPTDVRFVAYTSGTTSGRPLVSYCGAVDNYHFDPTLGYDDVTRLLIVYPPLNKHFGHTFIQQCEQSPRKPIPVFGDFQNLANSAVIAAQTNVDAIYATPTIAGLLAEHLEHHYDPKKITLLALASETLTAAKRAQLQTLYPNARIANLYASSEIGQFVLYPCKHMIETGEAAFHVLVPPVMAAELIDDELVVTYANNPAMPLIRYRTGDHFTEDGQPCSCGMSGPVLRWLGREDVDRIRAGGVEIRIDGVEDAFSGISHLIGSRYQLHFYEQAIGSNTRIRIVIEIPQEEIAKRMASPELVRASVLDHLLRSWHISANATLRDAITKGIFLEPEVTFVPEFSHQGVKMRKLVNHIHAH